MILNDKSHRVHLGDTGSYLEAFNSGDDKYLALYANGKFSIRCVNDGAVDLYYDGTIALKTSFLGVKDQDPVLGIKVGDGVNRSGITLDSSDKKYQLFCEKDGSFGTFHQRTAADEWEKDIIWWTKDGGVKLYHNGTKVIETVANGISAGVGSKTIHLWGSGGSCGLALGTGESILLYGTDGSVNLVKDEKVVFVASAVQTGIQKNNVSVFQAFDDGSDNRWTTMRDWNGTDRFTGDTTSSYIKDFNNKLRLLVYSGGELWLNDSNSDNKLKIGDYGGTLTGTWTGTVTPSDLAIKTDVKPLNGLEKLSLLDPISWDWKDPQYYDESMETIGFSVDSFEQVFPECVCDYDPMANQPMDTDDTDPSNTDSHKDKPISKEEQERIDYFKGVKGVKKGITSLKMEALIVDAIKELSNKIAFLQKEVDALKGAK